MIDKNGNKIQNTIQNREERKKTTKKEKMCTKKEKHEPKYQISPTLNIEKNPPWMLDAKKNRKKNCKERRILKFLIILYYNGLDFIISHTFRRTSNGNPWVHICSQINMASAMIRLNYA